MIHTETKFAYRHKPTGKWCFIYPDAHFGSDGKIEKFEIILQFVESFNEHILYNARNIIEEDLLNSNMNGERYAALNFLEFELVEIEIEYKIKL